MQQVKLPSGTVDVDEAGFLVDPATWTPEFARMIAEKEHITVTELHWLVIEFMRDYLDDRGVAADVRHVLHHLQDRLELDKHDAKAELFGLFPEGYVQQACKMAGMRQPRAWSTG